MNVKRGDRVVLTKASIKNDFDSDSERCKAHLDIEKVYTVESTFTDIFIYLKGYPDIPFKTVNFEKYFGDNWDLPLLSAQAEVAGLSESDKELISDGYHAFKELYEFRLLYNAAFFNELANQNVEVCKSKRHSDGKNVSMVTGL